MHILEIIKKKCDSWGPVIDGGHRYGRYTVKMHFDSKEDAEAFAEELRRLTIGVTPYEEVP